MATERTNIDKEVVRFAGVPEAFFEPFYMADFSDLQARPEFVPHPGGSGAMTKSLNDGSVDAAFLLTECAIAAEQTKQPSLKILSPIVESSLRWAVIIKDNNEKINSMSDLEGDDMTWGISRYGSGSHLMVMIHAAKEKWSIQPKFKVCQNLTGLLDDLEKGNIDVFLWEWFTTSPYIEKHHLKFISYIPTPWKCFCIAIHSDCTQHKIDIILQVIKKFLAVAKLQFKQNADHLSVRTLIKKYKMTELNASTWLSLVEYCDPSYIQSLGTNEIKNIQDCLKLANII